MTNRVIIGGQWGDEGKGKIVDGHAVLAKVRQGTESVLFEGAQGTLLDLDHGSYPFVTSSSPSVGGALTGSGLPPKTLGDVNGVFKAYCTRVGNGPFPTELHDETGETLRATGGEVGATTGRPRRCGWFDLVAARYAVEINGMNGVFITKLDVLDAMDEIKVCTAYELDGETVEVFPTSAEAQARCTPVYRTFPGWDAPSGEARSLKDLPAKARQYLEFLEKELGVHVECVSVGPHRDQTIWTPEGVTT